ESNGVYQDYCRANGLAIHPARFPPLLPEYFIRMLTDPGDLVVDPFGGSCVTGAVAESLGRKWVCVELNSEYIRGAMARFEPESLRENSQQATTYPVHTPCSIPSDVDSVALVADGGFKRQLVAVGDEIEAKVTRSPQSRKASAERSSNR